MTPRLAAAAAFLALALLAASPCPAAQVWVDGGDRLTGEVVGMSGGKLKLKTAYAGVVSIDWARVKSLTSQNGLVVELLDGRRLHGPVTAGQAGRLAVGQPGRAKHAPLDKVAAINKAKPQGWQVSGQVNAGADVRDGNTNKDRYDLDGEAMIEKRPHRWRLAAESHRESSNGDETVDNDTVRAEYNRFVSTKWYAFGNLLWNRDKFKDLDARLGAGGGMGYQLLDSDQAKLSLELGPNYIYEKNQAGNSEDWFAARWAVNFSLWMWSKSLKLYHNHYGLVRVDNPDNTIIHASQGLTLPLGGGLQTSLQYDVDWDGAPEGEREETDTRLIFKLGYGF